MNFYRLYRASLERPLNEEERLQLAEWVKEWPHFSLLHMMQAREGDHNSDQTFKAAIYAPSRIQLQQYLKGRILWPRLVPEPDMEEKKQHTESLAVPGPEFGQSTPMFVGLDWTPELSEARVHAPTFGVLPERHASQAYLQQILTEKTLLHIKLIEKIKSQLSRFQKSAAPIEVNPADLPQSYRPVVREERQKRNAALIDQFLSEAPQLKRTRPKLALDAQPSEEHQQAAASTIADENLATETLAKLYIRQNNLEEAVRIYEQLSLRFPHKSSYFAAQIKKIKE